MRRSVVALAAVLLVLSGCGSNKTFANNPKPAVPVPLTVYLSNARISLSPAEVGAGLVTFMVTNQGDSTQSLQISPAGDSSAPLGSTGPISPQATTQIKVNLSHSGRYLVSASSGGSSDAQQATPGTIRPATLTVGPPRPSARNKLLLP